MPTFEIPQNDPKPPKLTPNPEPAHPGLQPIIGDVPDPRETTASKKVDDISRHESRHDMAPKHDPKLNPQGNTPDGSKPGGGKPQGGKHVPGSGKQ